MSASHLGTLFALGALLFFSASTLLTRLASDRVDSGIGFIIATSVNVIVCGLAVIIHALLRTEQAVLNVPAFGMFMLAGFFTTFLGRYFFFESVVRMGAARASTFGTTSPVFTALFGWIFLGDAVTLPSMIAMALVLLGLVLVAQRGKATPTSEALDTQSGTPVVADLPGTAARPQDTWRSLMILGLGSSAAYAIGNVARANGVRAWNEPIIGALVGAATGLLLQLIVNRGRLRIVDTFKAADPSGRGFYMAVGVANIVAQVMAIAAVKYLPVAEVVLITSASPLLVFPASYLFLRSSEAITRTAVLGLLLSLAGVAYLVGRPLLEG